MDQQRKHLLDLDDYCLLEIMKCIIGDCELIEEPPDHPLRYEDIENFAKAYEYIDGLLKAGFKSVYYRRELSLLAKLRCLSIDFGQLQSVNAKKKEGDAYWKLFIKAIQENYALERIQLIYDPSSSQTDFPKHFQMLTSAFENKERLRIFKLALNGYSLDDLPNFGHITELYLDVSMSAETLASVCKSNPELCKLEFMTSEIQGRLSDIVPHCRNLQYLKFVPKPDVDGSEYAPLVELPRLKEITIHGAYKNGSLLRMFGAIQKWHGSETLSVNFSDELPLMSKVTIVRMNSLRWLRITSRKIPPRIELSANYDFSEISRDSSPLEESLETITLMAASLAVDFQERVVTLLECPSSDIDISEFGSLLKLCHVNSLHIENKVPGQRHNPECQTPKAKLFASLMPDGLFGLKSIQIVQGHLNKFNTLELVKIKSVKLLKCTFSDWASIEHLSELSNLTTLGISVEKEFENTYSKALCKLLNTCQLSGVIDCKSWRIEFVKNKGISGEVRTLKVLYAWKRESLNELFEALSNSDLITIEEVHLEKVDFKDIAKITKVQSIKRLNLSMKDANGIEQLSELTQLEELTLKNTARGTLVKLLDQLATRESPSLQQFKLKSLSPEELFMVSRIKSLKKLELFSPFFRTDYDALSPEELPKDTRIKSLKKVELFSPFFSTDYDALNELANSNIEELVFVRPQISLQKLLASFAARPSNRLQHLKIVKGTLDLEAFEELSKLKGLRSFHTSILDSNNLPFLQKLENLESLNVQSVSLDSKFHWKTLKTLVIHLPMDLKKLQCFAELENLESLTFSLLNYDWNHNNNDPSSDVLANIKNLKELHIETTGGSQHRIYQALALKKGLKLRHLSVPIEFAEELINIMRIKSLRTLHFQFKNFRYNEPFAIDSELDQLEELESLQIKRTHLSMPGNQLDTVLAILRSCRNLGSFSIKYSVNKHAKFVGDVHNLLRSIRDPESQNPLSLTIEDLYKNTKYDSIVYMNFIDDEYLKVYYTNI